MKNRRSARYGLLAAVATLSFAAAACGDDEETTDTTAGGGTDTTEMTGTTTMGTDMTGTTGTEGAGPTGPACESVPAEGEGSFEGMADDPAATAASNNKELSTL
ncbi:MAG: fasciclin domain-containing protein, partial [Actinomycetota bacterium]|nr:fasciclin domain-containing protein [Actinomycetota bacterium]